MPDNTVPGDADSDTADDSGATTEARARRSTPVWLETIVLLVVALAMALVIKTFFVQAFYIPSSSMEPGLVVNDRIMVQKIGYWFGGEPERGDVVVFEDPGGWLNGEPAGPTSVLSKGLAKVGLYPTGGHLVKRVIGVEGDTVTCCDDDGRLAVNGTPIDEDEFIAPQQRCDGPMPSNCDLNWSAGPVPDGMLFVMGDNRNASADSSARLCNPDRPRCDTNRAYVPVDLVVGKVFALVWPLSHAELVGRPDAFADVEDAR